MARDGGDEAIRRLMVELARPAGLEHGPELHRIRVRDLLKAGADVTVVAEWVERHGGRRRREARSPGARQSGRGMPGRRVAVDEFLLDSAALVGTEGETPEARHSAASPGLRRARPQ